MILEQTFDTKSFLDKNIDEKILEERNQEKIIQNEEFDNTPDNSDELSALSVFMDDIEQLKEKNKMKQGDIAEKMNTTQSAVSRLISARANPTYKQLTALAKAVGGKIAFSAFGDYSITAPVDLHDDIKKLAEKENKDITDYLQDLLRDRIEKEMQYPEKWSVDFTDNSNERYEELCG